jgi:competence protein ComGC
MRHFRGTNRLGLGMTLAEMLVAVAIVVVLFAAIIPQIRAIQNSWASKMGNAEAIQNGAVLVNHITFNLTQAERITAVSDSSETNGYIEFEDNDGNVMRYEVGVSNYVEFGPVGNLSELAGPVSRLQFTCYDACDLDTPITDVNAIRSVQAQSTFTNSAGLGRDQIFTGQAYLRTNALGGADSVPTVAEEAGSELEFDTQNGEQNVLCRIDDGNYLCAYSGMGADGWAAILAVCSGNWTISKTASLEFDGQQCVNPALVSIDPATYSYLCAYTGRLDDGFAVILHAIGTPATIVKRIPFEFDESNCEGAALSRIDSGNFLCAYTGEGSKGTAVILIADVMMGTVTKGMPFVFDSNVVEGCNLASIDDVHYLCSYGSGAGSKAVVLTVDTGSGTVSKVSGFVFDLSRATGTALCKIDESHYVCVYEVVGTTGYAVVLTVDTGSWTIGKGSAAAIHTDQAHYPAVVRASGNDYLCAYGEFGEDGTARVLRVDTDADSVNCGSPFEYDEVKGKWPALAKVDDTHILCAYTGHADDGYAVILTVGAPILP